MATPSDVQAAGLPFEEAIDFFRGKVPVHSQHWTDVWRTAHSRSFMVAGAATDALLADFQAAIRKALESGTTLAEFRQDFDGIVQRHGWVHNGAPGWRARVIYETNLATAYSAGRYVQLTQPETKRAFPFWQYVHSGSSHPRLQHLAWNGLTLRCDDAFWNSHFPPNGWHCGCRVRPVSDGDLARMGRDGPDDAPPVETRKWMNPRTGEVHDVPVGIDPGFDYNPGKAWKSGLADIPARAPRLRPLEPRPLQPTDAQQDALRAFVEHPTGVLSIGRVPDQVRHALGSATGDVLLSAETMEKQLYRHPDLTADDYMLAPLVLSAPGLVLQHEDRHVILLRAGAKTLAAVVKTTALAHENYLVSLYAPSEKSLRTLLRRGRTLFGSAEAVGAKPAPGT